MSKVANGEVYIAILGDFNLHVRSGDADANALMDTMKALGYTQLVTFLMHNAGSEYRMHHRESSCQITQSCP